MSEICKLSAMETVAPYLRPAKVKVVEARLKQRAAPRAESSPMKFSNFDRLVCRIVVSMHSTSPRANLQCHCAGFDHDVPKSFEGAMRLWLDFVNDLALVPGQCRILFCIGGFDAIAVCTPPVP